MKVRTGITAAMLAMGLGASAAQAATYSFGGSGGNLGATTVFVGAGGPDVSVAASASGILNGGEATITQTPGGLGVNGRPDTQPDQLDGNPIFSQETLTFTFDWAVKIVSFGLSSVDGGIFGVGADQIDYSTDGGATWTTLNAAVSNLVGANYVKSFALRASGSFLLDGDDVKVASIETASVPLPAGGLLLIGGLAGLAALRRRKTA